ncbi:SET domain-containing protein [Russula earlei]|uniref:SET domain-containing protein n=1 Tax=Russula earlei TaxID=71964 RepID=A0ACC0U6Z5_9AGAM|nr:SET domain-containing protein [Russula earlei]
MDVSVSVSVSELVTWFTAHNGIFDRSALTFAQIDGLGWGALALRDLQQGHTLFSIPRHLTLSTRTSSLPSLIGEADWKRHGLHIGWSGLILCLMWEAAQGSSSRWSTYLASLPITFNTPMFWSSEDVEQLRGTAIIERIGREQAENDYLNKVVPLLKNRTDYFGDEHANLHYSLEAYHIMGSRILSRSFQVEAWSATYNVDTSQTPPHEDPEMSLDKHSPQALDDNSSDEDEDKDSDDGENDDPANVAMVPLADMLNARYDCENAKLFYEEHFLRMATTRSIRRGEQIWNTYGDPPNSDLLRRYGHVDQVPLPCGGSGNPADIVEIRADLVMSSVGAKCLQQASPRSSERIDWWLEEGGDDIFVVDFSAELPEELTSFVRLLMMSDPEWAKTKRKSKLPKPKVDDAVLSVVADVLRRRLAEYPTTIEDDEALLGTEKEKPIPLNVKNAVVVRLSEKRILGNLQRAVTTRLGGDPSESKSSVSSRKRKADGTDADGHRAAKR